MRWNSKQQLQPGNHSSYLESSTAKDASLSRSIRNYNRQTLVIWSNSQALPMASRNDCLLALTSGSTFCRSRTAGGLGRLRSAGGGGRRRDLTASESKGRPVAADAAFRWSTTPFLATFSESLLPVTQKTHQKTKLKPGLVTPYGIWPGNGVRLFW